MQLREAFGMKETQMQKSVHHDFYKSHGLSQEDGDGHSSSYARAKPGPHVSTFDKHLTKSGYGRHQGGDDHTDHGTPDESITHAYYHPKHDQTVFVHQDPKGKVGAVSELRGYGGPSNSR